MTAPVRPAPLDEVSLLTERCQRILEELGEPDRALGIQQPGAFGDRPLGTILGAVLMQTIENGLVLLNANPYLYPLFTAAIIFLAVALDSLRNGLFAKWTRRTIRPA